MAHVSWQSFPILPAASSPNRISWIHGFSLGLSGPSTSFFDIRRPSVGSRHVEQVDGRPNNDANRPFIYTVLCPSWRELGQPFFFLFCCWEGQNHGRDLLDGRSRWGERGSWWKWDCECGRDEPSWLSIKREREERWRGRKKERIECYRCTTRPSGAIRARTVASLSCVCCCFGPPLLCLFPRPGSVSIIPWCPSALTAAGVRARPRPVRKSISAAPHRINAFHSDGPEEENRLVLFLLLLLLLLSRIAVSIGARIFCFISRFLHTQRGRMTRRPSLLAWWCRVLLVDVAIIAPAAEHRQNMEEHSKCTCSLALGPGSWSSVAIRFH